MKLLTAVGPERMKFTQIDQELYDSFRENFPDFNIENVDEESMKTIQRKTAVLHFGFSFSRSKLHEIKKERIKRFSKPQRPLKKPQPPRQKWVVAVAANAD